MHPARPDGTSRRRNGERRRGAAAEKRSQALESLDLSSAVELLRTSTRRGRLRTRAEHAPAVPGPALHVRWAWTERDHFVARAAEFLADGAAAGERLFYVGSGPVQGLCSELIDAVHPEARRIQAVPVQDFYRLTGDGRLEPFATLEKLRMLGASALSAGYRGVRIVVDATTLLRTPAQRAAFAHFEHLLSRSLRHRSISVLCTADARLLAEAVAESRPN